MKRSILSHFARFSATAFAIAIFFSLLASLMFGSFDIVENYHKVAIVAAEDVQFILDTTTYDEATSSTTSEEYESLRESIRLACAMYHAEYISVYKVDRALGTRTYLFCVAGMDDTDEVIRKERSLGTQVNTELSKQELEAASGIPSTDFEKVNNDFGSVLTWYFPCDLDGSDKPLVIGIDFNAHEEQQEVIEHALSFLIPLIIAITVIVALELGALKRSVLDPLKKLSSRMSSFIKDGEQSQEPVEISKTTEIAEIQTSFDQMTADINTYVDRITQMREERATAATELAVAQRIQLGLIPPTMHCKGKGYDAYAFERTARAVGGDFYDLVELNDGKLMCVIADVSGKGVSAAIFMAMFRTLLRENLQRSADPARALNRANDIVASNNPECMFVTIFASVYDPVTGVLTYANAGHNPPLMTDGTYLSPDPGIALGVFEDAGIVNETLVLKPGEGILFYTDGATESVNPNDEFFGEERLVQAAHNKQDAKSMVHATVDAVDDFAGEREQFDDLTLLALFATDPSQVSWQITLEPELSSFSNVREHIMELCGENPKAKQVVLACDEAFANVVNYSQATVVEIELCVTSDAIVARITDNGIPFDPLTYDQDERAFEDLDMGGMGIILIREASDDIAYEYTDGKNVLTMRFELS